MPNKTMTSAARRPFSKAAALAMVATGALTLAMTPPAFAKAQHRVHHAARMASPASPDARSMETYHYDRDYGFTPARPESSRYSYGWSAPAGR